MLVAECKLNEIEPEIEAERDSDAEVVSSNVSDRVGVAVQLTKVMLLCCECDVDLEYDDDGSCEPVIDGEIEGSLERVADRLVVVVGDLVSLAEFFCVGDEELLRSFVSLCVTDAVEVCDGLEVCVRLGEGVRPDLDAVVS